MLILIERYVYNSIYSSIPASKQVDYDQFEVSGGER